MEKKWCVSFVFLFLLVVFVSALSIDVGDVNLKEEYIPGQVLEGNITIELSDAYYDSLITSNLLSGSEITLGEFLDANDVEYNCSPPDCSEDFEIVESEDFLTFAVGPSEKTYVGFVLYGDVVSFEDDDVISFDIDSDFEESTQIPLRARFFGGAQWEFYEPSNSYSSKDYSCYDNSSRVLDNEIRGSNYCGEFNVSKTGGLFLGADVSSDDNKELSMFVYDGVDGNLITDCDFNPSSGEEGCEVSSSEIGFFDGEYIVCVGKSGVDTSYRIYSESNGSNCGFVYGGQDNNRIKDYAVFVREAKFAGSNELFIDQDIADDFLNSANEILYSRYKRGDCSEGCILPIEFEGIDQNVTISNVFIEYTSAVTGDESANEVSSLESIKATLDFEGVLELEHLGFEVTNEEEVQIYIDGEEILDEEIEILEAPYIKSVYPLEVPAGVPVIFYANVRNEEMVDSFNWDFGESDSDSDNVRSNNRSTIYTYDDIGNYTLTLEVEVDDNEDFGSSKEFSINVISPKKAVNKTLEKLRDTVDDVERQISVFPDWYEDKLRDLSNITFYDDELRRFENMNKNADEDDDYIEIAKGIFALDFPLSVYVSESNVIPLSTEIEDINPLVIQNIAGGNYDNDTLDRYKNSILRWQTESVDSIVDMKVVSVSKNSGSIVPLIGVYNIDVVSNDGVESYFVINEELNSLYFKEAYGERREGDSSFIVLDDGVDETIGLYSVGNKELSFFVSPQLSYLPVSEGEIGECNFNKVCEKDNGEDYKNCRSDCKPVGWMIFWIIIVLLVGLVLYTVAQVWYKKNYESYLFKNKNELYNLLMFVTNARARGMTDNKIVEQLHSKGWKTEKIVYALRKSRGERTGMYEIIPVEKIMSYFRNMKAKKDVSQGIKRNVPLPPSFSGQRGNVSTQPQKRL